MEWNAHTRIKAEEGIVACEISDGSALLNLSTSRYYKLNETAGLLWQELEQSNHRCRTLDELCETLARHYDIEKTTCRSDVCQLFEGFAKSNLVRIEN
ncbi:MAG: PqqD family protein [Erythrobacter sp.]